MIRPAEEIDVYPIGDNMRHSDIREIWSSHTKPPHAALKMSLKYSKQCLTATHRNEPIAMFGIVPVVPDADRACIWLLATPKAEELWVCFGVLTKKLIRHFLTQYKSLYNFVDVRNKTTVRWLQWAGAKFNEPAPYGDHGELFQYFCIERK